jgi:hypothetical protein
MKKNDKIGYHYVRMHTTKSQEKLALKSGGVSGLVFLNLHLIKKWTAEFLVSGNCLVYLMMDNIQHHYNLQHELHTNLFLFKVV